MKRMVQIDSIPIEELEDMTPEERATHFMEVEDVEPVKKSDKK